MSKHPFVLFLILMGVTFVGGVSYMILTAQPTIAPAQPVVSDVSEPKTFVYVVDDIRGDLSLSLELPSTWSDVEHLSDFAGYGAGEGDVSEVSGFAVTLIRDGKPYVAITILDAADAKSKAIPKTAELILETDTNAYFAEFPDEAAYQSWDQEMTDEDRARVEEAKVFVKTLKEITK